MTEQTERRVFGGETVPAGEKVVSLFEPHTDIIVKSGRGTHYGHKINLATGRSGLVLDVVVEDGNPADSARCLPMLGRHIEHYGVAPSRAAFDGGYASRANLKQAKALGIEHVVFHKKRSLKVEDMTRSSWLYGQLKRFRAGVEAGISRSKWGPYKTIEFVDPSAPASLSVSGPLLTLRYPGALDAGSTPSGGDFVVLAGTPGGGAGDLGVGARRRGLAGASAPGDAGRDGDADLSHGRHAPDPRRAGPAGGAAGGRAGAQRDRRVRRPGVGRDRGPGSA